VLSPWFPRQGNSVRMTLDVTQINAATIEVRVFTKNSEDAGDGADADAGTSIKAECAADRIGSYGTEAEPTQGTAPMEA
jgi:hypothetical protein